MDLNFTIIKGLFKLILLLFIFTLIAWRNIVKKRNFFSIFDTAMRIFFVYFSLTILLLFITIQLGIYDAIVVNIFLGFFILFNIFYSKNFKETKQNFQSITSGIVLKYVKFFENDFLSKKRNYKSISLFFKKQNLSVFYSLIILVIFVIFASLYYLKFDTYLFTDQWFDSLAMINAKDKSIWFTNGINVEGQYAFMNYLKHITNSSTEITMYISVIFEYLILIVILYWFIYKFSESSIAVPIFVSLFFILGFSFLPVNINTFFQTSSINLSFLLVFPILYYFLRPKSLSIPKKRYFLSFTCSFIAIGLIDLYILCLVFPIFFTLGFIIYMGKNLKKRLLIFGAYLFSILIVFAIYIFSAIINKQDFVIFLKGNLISVESNFLNPYIVTVFDKLLFYYQVMFTITSILIILFGLIFKHSWRKKIILMLFCTVIYILTQIDSKLIDNDLLYRLLLLFLPIQIGILLTTIIAFFKIIIRKNVSYSYRGIIVFSIVAIALIYLEKEPLALKKDTKKLLNEDILLANEEILNTYHDRSYVVVNRNELSMLSSYYRYFMTYTYFLSDRYIKRDALYAKYRENLPYLKKNPNMVLASSILVFVYENDPVKNKLLIQINRLKKLGRKTRKIHKSSFLNVYEVINEPNASRTADMIF